MNVRQRRLEEKLDLQERSIHGMQTQITTLQYHVLDILKAQFCRLATVITEQLQLPQTQSKLLQQVLDDQINVLAQSKTLDLPTVPLSTPEETPAMTESATNQPKQQANLRDPRLRHTAPMED